MGQEGKDSWGPTLGLCLEAQCLPVSLLQHLMPSIQCFVWEVAGHSLSCRMQERTLEISSLIIRTTYSPGLSPHLHSSGHRQVGRAGSLCSPHPCERSCRRGGICGRAQRPHHWRPRLSAVQPGSQQAQQRLLCEPPAPEHCRAAPPPHPWEDRAPGADTGVGPPHICSQSRLSWFPPQAAPSIPCPRHSKPPTFTPTCPTPAAAPFQPSSCPPNRPASRSFSPWHSGEVRDWQDLFSGPSPTDPNRTWSRQDEVKKPAGTSRR